MPENGFNELPDSVSLDSGDSQLSRQSLSTEATDSILSSGNTSQNNFDSSNDLSNILGNLEIEDNGSNITQTGRLLAEWKQ